MEGILLYFLNFIPLIINFWISFKKKRVYCVFFVGLLVQHLINLFTINQLLEYFGEQVLLKGQILMLLGNSIYFLYLICIDFHILKKPQVNLDNIINDSNAKINNTYFWFIITTSIVSLACLVLSVGISSLINDNWQLRRNNTDTGLLFRLGIQLTFSFYPLIYFLWIKRKPLLFVTSLILGLTFVLVSGSRASAITLPGAAFFWVMYNKDNYRKKLRTFFLTGSISFLVHNFLRLIRGFGIQFLLNPTKHFEIILSNSDFSGGESSTYYTYNFLIQSNLQSVNDLISNPLGTTLLRIFYIYIPSSLMPEKPMDVTYEIWEHALTGGLFNDNSYRNTLLLLLQEGKHGSLHPLFWGDAFYNLGLLGVIIYPLFFGFIFTMIEYFIHYHLLKKHGLITVSCILPVIASGYLFLSRGNIVIGMGYIAHLIPMFLTMYFIFKLITKYFHLPWLL
ncbi:hypothetical protein PN483_01860 [Nodularia spumigena CS-591/04]|uniref:hypothetical protein n=1 Tax=Nodularia spumigena TaxID=70799 RepID=UPI00232D2CFA|nr:hypothetical protein [Nodularia spumigena]MDB9321322.1 hypothetical protein [Nodularia spumigena CS-591/07A]MDB9329261.1 hypothetical protein [Nodularia spumigena CS-591/04]